MTKQNILIGADPEFFLRDIKTKKFISAHGLVPGDKKNPHKLEDGACQLDGTAIEFNINPAGSALEFEYNVHSVLKQLRAMIPKQYEFVFEPAIHYDKEYWKTIPEDYKVLGCDPDFNAYSHGATPQTPPKPVNTMRTGAGHIHIGWTDKAEPTDEIHFWDCRTIIQDLNTWYTNINKIWDTDTQRKNMYGNGAVFRPKSYGVEFRTPSNAWLNYPNLWAWIFDSVKEVFFHSNDRLTLNNYLYIYEYLNETPEKKVKAYNMFASRCKFPSVPKDYNLKVSM